jgi:hypothetical protein
MPDTQRWNHVNFAVAPEQLPLIETCLDALFGWEKIVSKSTLLGYRLSADLHDAALYFRPVPAAGHLQTALARLRTTDVSLAGALDDLGRIEADWADHTGFMVASVAEWETRLEHVRRLAAARPDFCVTVVDVLRPGDGRSATTDLLQAFIRVGLLGAFRNTFEMQARRP